MFLAEIWKILDFFIWKFSYFWWWNFQYIWIGVFFVMWPLCDRPNLRIQPEHRIKIHVSFSVRRYIYIIKFLCAQHTHEITTIFRHRSDVRNPNNDVSTSLQRYDVTATSECRCCDNVCCPDIWDNAGINYLFWSFWTSGHIHYVKIKFRLKLVRELRECACNRYSSWTDLIKLSLLFSVVAFLDYFLQTDKEDLIILYNAQIEPRSIHIWAHHLLTAPLQCNISF